MKTGPATRGDLETLTALNDEYIASVQHGDVGRFDQILAEDFLCSNPDGSLLGKPQFLAQTARPVTINGPWRLVFEFKNGHAYHVEIVDYH
jgi:hypothetical protein